MECRKIDELMVDLLYRELDAPREGEVRAHLDGCGRCRDEVARFERTRAATSALVQVEPPRAARAKLLHVAALRAKGHSRPGAWSWLMGHPALAAAASLVLVAGVATMLAQRHLVAPAREAAPPLAPAPPTAAMAPPAGPQEVAAVDRPKAAPAMEERVGRVAEPEKQAALSQQVAKKKDSARGRGSAMGRLASQSPAAPEHAPRAAKALPRKFAEAPLEQLMEGAASAQRGLMNQEVSRGGSRSAADPTAAAAAADEKAYRNDAESAPPKPKSAPASAAPSPEVVKLHEAARAAARKQDCPAVRRLKAQISALDPAYYARHVASARDLDCQATKPVSVPAN